MNIMIENDFKVPMIKSEDLENDDIEIVVCSVVSEGGITDMDELLVVDTTMNTYRIEVDDTEYTMIVDLETNDSIATSDENKEEQCDDYTGDEEESAIKPEKSQSTGNQFRFNPDVCNRECHYTRWREHHPFKHEWEVKCVCNICGENLSESSLSSHMIIHCSHFIHCKFCGSDLENNFEGTNISDITHLLHNFMLKDMTESLNEWEANKENLVTDQQNLNKENLKINPQTKNLNINPEADNLIINPAPENLEINSETENSKIDSETENLESIESETEDYITEEIKQLMDENTRKWGPLLEPVLEIEIFQTVKLNTHEPQSLGALRNMPFSSKPKLCIDAMKGSNETLISKSVKLDRKRPAKKDIAGLFATNACKVCKKKYASVQKLKRHSSIHDSLYPYTCDFCLRTFNLKEYLTRHMKIHFKMGYVSCKICSREFSRNSFLSRHMTVHSDQHLNAKKRRKPRLNAEKPRKTGLNAEKPRNIQKNNAKGIRTKMNRSQKGKIKCVVVEQNKPAEVNRHELKCHSKKLTDKVSSFNREIRKLVVGHSDKPADQHKCDVCNKVSQSLRHLERHKKLHMMYGKQCCSFCK